MSEDGAEHDVVVISEQPLALRRPVKVHGHAVPATPLLAVVGARGGSRRSAVSLDALLPLVPQGLLRPVHTIIGVLVVLAQEFLNLVD